MKSARNLSVAILALLGILFAFSERAIAEPRWWNKAWPYRRAVVVSNRDQEYDDTKLAWCAFGAGEEMAKEGRDIRVTDKDGNLVAHEVIYARPGRICEVVFETSGQGTYYIYYGNDKAGPGARQLKLERGLILETRSRPSGRCNSWNDFQKLLKESSELYGRGVRRKIFDGFNPYGPSDNYISIYTGFIYCPESGTYRFALNSDESSFFFVNGTKVVEWAGNHGPAGSYGQHNGAIELKKGFHKIKYYHEEQAGGQACVLGWWTPGAKQVCLVPETAFPLFLKGKTGSLEKLNSDIACDCVFQYRSDVQLPGHLFCEIAFFDRSKGNKGRISREWDFGDGTTSQEQNPVHIYFAPGYYEVKLTVTGSGGQKDTTMRTIYAGQLFIAARDRRKSNKYRRIARNVDYQKLDAKNLLGVKALLDFVEDSDVLVEVCKELAKRGTELDSSARYDVLLTLGDLLRKEIRDANGAMAAYEQIVKESLSKKRILMGKIGIADVTYQLKKEYDKAMKLYEEIIEKYEDVSLAYCRLAKIRTGDIWRERGDYAKSLAAYEKANEMRRLIGHIDESLEKGQLAITIEAYLRENEYDEALEKLDIWDWEYPEDKLSGYSSILRGKANYGLEKFQLVIDDLTALVKVNSGKDVPRRSNYLAEAKYMTAYAYLRLEKYDKAVEWMLRVLDEHPESDLLKKAAEVIEQCKNQLKK